MREAASALRRHFGGKISELNPFVLELRDSELGTIEIERDAELLTSARYRELFEKLDVDFDPNTLANEIEKGVDRLTSVLIPCEVVTAPLPFESFPAVERIVSTLRALDAKGTDDSLLFAFGLHLNPSVPVLDAATIATFLRSFLLLADWIIDAASVDFSRRYLTSFIDPFPEEFVELVLDPDYPRRPERFMSDYLDHNRTRNRALDLLPVLAEIDEERVTSAIDSEDRSLVSARPAFHYRLPDCRPGDETWSVAGEWNRWWYVETVAADADLLRRLVARWQESSQGPRITRKARWIDTVGAFLEEHVETPGSP